MRITIGKAATFAAILLFTLPVGATEAIPAPPVAGGGGGDGGGSANTPAAVTLERVEVNGTREPGASTAGIPSGNLGVLFYLPSGAGSGGQSRKAQPAADANEKPSCQNPKSQNPVILSSGEKYAEATDFSASGIYRLGLTQYCSYT